MLTAVEWQQSYGRTIMLFIMSMNFTERGIREIKDDPKRAQAAKDLAKK